MAVTSTREPGAAHHGVVTITVDHPPVNALPVAGWFALADARPGRRAGP